MQVKYANDLNSDRTIENKIIGVHELKERSSAKTMYDAFSEKLLDLEEIRQNMVAIAHDNVQSLIVNKGGLAMLLQRENEFLFSLRDPCHSLNLIVENSLGTLPKEVLELLMEYILILSHIKEELYLLEFKERII